MAEICPGDLNGFLFPSGGGEANEVRFRNRSTTVFRPVFGGPWLTWLGPVWTWLGG